MDIRDKGDREDQMIVAFEEDYGQLPKHKIVCPTCDGKGRHVNPSIDSHGISMDEFYDDPYFAEDYMSGAYDVICYRCHGNNVVDDVDEDCLKENNPDLYEDWMAYQDAVYNCWAEDAAEKRAMGYY